MFRGIFHCLFLARTHLRAYNAYDSVNSTSSPGLIKAHGGTDEKRLYSIHISYIFLISAQTKTDKKEKETMKTRIIVLLLLCLLVAFTAFAQAETVYDAGRLSVSAAGSWNVSYAEDAAIMLSQGIPYISPYVSITYFPVGDIFFDAKEWYDNVTDLEPFTTGSYTWTAYDGSSMGMDFTIAIAEVEYGTLYVIMTRNETLTITRDDIQSMLASIQVVPSVTGDWFELSEDGTLTVTLTEPDGFHWQESGYGYYAPEDDSPEPEIELEENCENGVYTLTLKDTTDGWFTQYFYLSSDDAGAGQASITAVVSDGKIGMISKAQMEIYDEPQVYESSEYVPATGEDYVGAWFDETSQRATLEITPLEDDQYEILVSWSSSASETTQWRMTGLMDGAGDLAYENGTKVHVTYDESGEATAEETVYTDADGWFSYAGDRLLWIDFTEETACDFSFVRGE